jgi:hypothetical protein
MRYANVTGVSLNANTTQSVRESYDRIAEAYAHRYVNELEHKPLTHSALIVAIVVMIIIAIAVMFVPATMLSAVMLPIVVLISIMIPVAVPIVVTISIVVSMPIPLMISVGVVVSIPGATTLVWAAIPAPATPGYTTARRYVSVRSIRGYAVMPIDVLHPAFHAADLTLVVGGLVALPTGVIAVKPSLIAYGKPNLGLSEMRESERREQGHEYELLLH